MKLYRRALFLLFNIMNNAGIDYWAKYIKENIDEWDELQSVERHLKAYHKEGLSDRWICVENGDYIEPQYEPWANALKDCICSVVVSCGRRIKDNIEYNDDIDIIIDEIVATNNAYSSYRPLIATVCERCGDISFSSISVERAISLLLSPAIIRQYFNLNLELKLIDYGYIMDLPIVNTLRVKVIQEIRSMRYKHRNLIADVPWSCNKCHSTRYSHKYFEIFENGDDLIIKQKY